MQGSDEKRTSAQRVLCRFALLLAEGFAVGTLVHGRVAFVSAHGDATECAVVGSVTVICARGNVALDAFVLFGIAVHVQNSFSLVSEIVFPIS